MRSCAVRRLIPKIRSLSEITGVEKAPDRVTNLGSCANSIGEQRYSDKIVRFPVFYACLAINYPYNLSV